MVVKKSNVIPVSWTNKNIMFFQDLGFLNKKKKSTGRQNLSEYVNRCVDRIIAIDWPELDDSVEEKLLLMKMQDLQEKEDRFLKVIERDKREVARAIAEVRALKKPKKLETPDIDAQAVLQVIPPEA